MATKQFKAESKRLLDLMINSIYTHKEIFLRELISNASDATDKLYYNAMKEGKTGITRDSLPIELTLDKANRRFIIEDHGCGMTAEEMENNLGTIAGVQERKRKAGRHRHHRSVRRWLLCGIYGRKAC